MSCDLEAGLALCPLASGKSLLHHLLVLCSDDLHEFWQKGIESIENEAAARTPRIGDMSLDQPQEKLTVIRIFDGLEVHHSGVAPLPEVVILIEHKGQAAAHSRGEV